MCQAGSATLLPSDGKARVKQFNVSVVRLGCWVFTFSRQMPAPGRQQAHSGSEVCSSKWERGVPSSLAQLKLSIHFTNTFSKIEKYTLQGQIRFGTLTRLNVGRCVLLHCPIKTELTFYSLDKYVLQSGEIYFTLQGRFGTLTRLNVGRCVLVHYPIKTGL